MENFAGLAAAIFMSLLTFLWIYCIGDWMVEGEISVPTGLVAIAASLPLLAIGIAAPSDLILYGVMILLALAPISLPLINMISGESSNRELDIRQFEKVHEAFALNPANIGSRFEIARMLAKRGLYGHAVAIGRGAESLLTDDQGAHQRGTRGMFTRELAEVKYWESVAKPDDYRNVHCPHCSVPNPPGMIACQKCGAPFLLDIVRQNRPSKHLQAKIILIWICLAAVVACGGLLGLQGEGWTVIFPITLLVLAVAVIASWLLKDRTKFA